MRTRTTLLPVLLVTTLALAGCEEDPRLVRLATEAADRQAEQNEAMARLQTEVAEGTRRLVEEQASARQAADQERQQLNTGWDALEAERRQIARQRRTVSLVTTAVRGGSLLLIVLFCLALALLTLRNSATESTTSADLVDLLVRQAVEGEPRPAALDRADPPAARESGGDRPS